jgi:membrane protease YdiL (CAAX protease family)
MLIGLIEEFFFRGFLFLTLKDLWNTKGSLVVTNLIYALVHFFPKNRPFVGPEPRAWDSFRILGSMVPDLGRTEILGAFLGLFLFGLLLSLAFLRTGSLFLPIGIHGGCVFALKMSPRFVPDISEKMGIWSGSKNLYDGIAGLVVLALLNFIAIGISRDQSKGLVGQGGVS